MPLFRNVVGTPTTPQFVEIVQRAQCATSNGGTKQILNVWHLQCPLGAVAFDPTALQTAFAAIFGGLLFNALNARYNMVQWEVRPMDDPSAATTIVPDTSQGEVETDSYDTASAVYMLIRTGYRGRSFKGSKHFTPLSEEDTTEDELTGAGLTRWQAVKTALNTMVAGFNDAGGNTWFPIVLSRELSTLDTIPSVFTGATWKEVLLNLTIGTMRHRKEKTAR